MRRESMKVQEENRKVELQGESKAIRGIARLQRSLPLSHAAFCMHILSFVLVDLASRTAVL